MGTAYTPGLTVSDDQIVRKTRRLPLKGDVVVNAGDLVTPATVIARTELPGILQTVRVAEKLGVDPKDVRGILVVPIGGKVSIGQMLAESKGLFGLFKNSVTSDYEGTLESLSELSGHVLIREAPIPVEITAYMDGKVVEVIPGEGAVIETRGAMIQGIFGVGGERQGAIRVAVNSAAHVLDKEDVPPDASGCILIGGSGVTFDAIKEAERVGAAGLVAGAVRDVDVIQYLGYDIGVAITGQEHIPLSIMATEGFGELAMAGRTFDLLKSLEGHMASMNGATQIRAGVIRPELIVPAKDVRAGEPAVGSSGALNPGTPIRVIREPYFGKIGKVTSLPPELRVVESGTSVRVLEAELEDGSSVMVPRANVEIIAG